MPYVKFGIAIDWTAENIMPYIEQLCAKFINFEIYNISLLDMFYDGIKFIMSDYCWRLQSQSKKKLDYPWDDEIVTWVAIVGVVVAGVLSFATIITIGCQIYDIVVATTFPENHL